MPDCPPSRILLLKSSGSASMRGIVVVHIYCIRTVKVLEKFPQINQNILKALVTFKDHIFVIIALDKLISGH